MSEQIVGREAELAMLDEFVEAVPGGVVALSLQAREAERPIPANSHAHSGAACHAKN